MICLDPSNSAYCCILRTVPGDNVFNVLIEKLYRPVVHVGRWVDTSVPEAYIGAA